MSEAEIACTAIAQFITVIFAAVIIVAAIGGAIARKLSKLNIRRIRR